MADRDLLVQLPAVHLHAGVFEPKYKKTGDGFEMTWQVNVMAPFLLTSLLFDRIKDRVVIVSSMSAGSHIDFDNLNQVAPHNHLPSFGLKVVCRMECNAFSLLSLRLGEDVKLVSFNGNSGLLAVLECRICFVMRCVRPASLAIGEQHTGCSCTQQRDFP